MNHLEKEIFIGIDMADRLPEPYREEVLGIYMKAVAALEAGAGYEEVSNIITPIRGDVDIVLNGRRARELESFIIHAHQRLTEVLYVLHEKS